MQTISSMVNHPASGESFTFPSDVRSTILLMNQESSLLSECFALIWWDEKKVASCFTWLGLVKNGKNELVFMQIDINIDSKSIFSLFCIQLKRFYAGTRLTLWWRRKNAHTKWNGQSRSDQVLIKIDFCSWSFLISSLETFFFFSSLVCLALVCLFGLPSAVVSLVQCVSSCMRFRFFFFR